MSLLDNSRRGIYWRLHQLARTEHVAELGVLLWEVGLRGRLIVRVLNAEVVGTVGVKLQGMVLLKALQLPAKLAAVLLY